MTGHLTPDLCVIGAGSGGLSVAAAAALMGVRVVLVEKGAMGGDCLNMGCIPSKALIAAGKRAQAIRDAAPFGIKSTAPRIDAAGVADHIAQIIAGIAPMDSTARFTGLGVQVIAGHGRFLDAATLVVDTVLIKARRFVIATGSQPAIPPISGLRDTPFLTNETIFSLRETPQHLLVLGGGPIGIELAQAHRRLGAKVSVIEINTILAREDREAADLLRTTLQREGIEVIEGHGVTQVSGEKGAIALTLKNQADEGAPARMVRGSHLLVATGRLPVIQDLGLDAAGIDVGKDGIAVDAGLRTSNRRVYAIGDAKGAPQFTHAANYEAGLVLRSALFRLPVRASYAALPRVTYCAPEIASIGLLEAEAVRQGLRFDSLRVPFSENDRARTERDEVGFIKALVDRRGYLLGVTIIGAQAGDLLTPFALAMSQRLKLSAFAQLVLPYPTRSEAIRRLALLPLQKTARALWLGRLLRFLRLFG